MRQRASFSADDTRRNTVLKTERRTDSNDPFPDLEIVRISLRYFRQIGGIDLNQCNIRFPVGTDNFGCEFALIVQFYRNLIGSLDNMRIGQNITVRTDNKTGA